MRANGSWSFLVQRLKDFTSRRARKNPPIASILKHHHPIGGSRDIKIMGHHNQSGITCNGLLQHFEDGCTGIYVQRPRGFIRE